MSAVLSEERAVALMTNKQVLELLRKIDDGYRPSKEEVERLSSIEKVTWNGIANIPGSIGFLTGLKELDAQGSLAVKSDLRSLPIGIKELKNLQSLNLSNTQLRELPEEIGYLTNLQILWLNSTCLIKLPESIGDLSRLKKLYLSGSYLCELPESIGNLKSLERLFLSSIRIKLPKSIGNLTSLLVLHLKACQTELPESIGNLISLQSLYLESCQVELPESIGNLKNLQNLILQNSFLSRLPDSIYNLPNLQTLDLSSASLRELPESIGELKNLDTLVLENLDLYELPESLLHLNLEYLHSKHTLFIQSPGIYIHGLKLQNQPVEIFSKSREFIIEYYKSNKKSTPINECKVVFLGDGGAGKSLMIDRLMNDGNISPDFNGNTTPGICISSKKYKIGDDEIELHFWDFGGQAIMHSMHRLFLTNRTLYVVVTNARDNKANNQAWYWIRNIKSFANGAPILLLVNQKDKNPSVTINENGLIKEYPQLKCVKIVSALEDTTDMFIEQVQDTICKIVFDMDTVHTPFAMSWLSLMNELQNMPENYITSSAFHDKCVMKGIETKKELLDEIIGWYQDLGICFYSQKHPVTGQYMVLKPKWLLNALYILIFNGRRYAANGIIREGAIYDLICKEVDEPDTKKVWHDIKYEPHEIQYIINVLLNFQLIYELNGFEEKHFFIPMLCDENEPMAGTFDSEEALHVSFEYSYLPENVLHRLMVRHGIELNMAVVWKTGAEFRSRRCGWTALVRIKDNCLDVYAKADHQETHPVNVYLDLMRESIYKINTSFGLSADEYITYRREGKSDRFKYKILEGSLKAGQRTIYSEKFESLINIDEILGIVKSPAELFAGGAGSQISLLLDSLLAALQSLQGNSDFYDVHENSCNTYVRDLLRMCGYICEDQTLHGLSGTRKGSGSPDILIRDKDSRKRLSIFEALRLKSFGKADREYLDEHISKLLDNYNMTGLTRLFLVSYVSWEKTKFNELVNQYYQYVMYDSKIPFGIMESELIDTVNDAFMMCMRVHYFCNGISMYVYHVVVRMAY